MLYPSVSVIIPSFNRGHLLKDVIPSFVQECVCEVIIIDDASTDNTPEVVADLILEFPLIKYFRSTSKVRQTGAKNIGISMAVGEYCFFGDDDCILKEGSISSLLSLAIDNPNYIIASRHMLMDSGQNLEELLLDNKVYNNLTTESFYDKNTLKLNLSAKSSVVHEIPFSQSCFLVKTEIAKIQKFNESFVMTCFREETDYVMQLCKNGYKVLLDPNSLMIDLPREHSHGGSRSIKIIRRHLGEVYNEYLFYSRNAEYISRIATLNTKPFVRAMGHLFNKVKNLLIR